MCGIAGDLISLFPPQGVTKAVLLKRSNVSTSCSLTNDGEVQQWKHQDVLLQKPILPLNCLGERGRCDAETTKDGAQEQFALIPVLLIQLLLQLQSCGSIARG